jgi:hypothetical protein
VTAGSHQLCHSENAAPVADDPSEAWRATRDLRVQVVSPRYGQLWSDQYVHDPFRDPRKVPSGTRLSQPVVVRSGPPVGANTCQLPPDDARDVEDWLDFTLLEAAGSMDAGATIRVRRADDKVNGLLAPMG